LERQAENDEEDVNFGAKDMIPCADVEKPLRRQKNCATIKNMKLKDREEL
jgi:hypothetical protein